MYVIKDHEHLSRQHRIVSLYHDEFHVLSPAFVVLDMHQYIELFQMRILVHVISIGFYGSL